MVQMNFREEVSRKIFLFKILLLHLELDREIFAMLVNIRKLVRYNAFNYHQLSIFSNVSRIESYATRREHRSCRSWGVEISITAALLNKNYPYAINVTAHES